MRARSPVDNFHSPVSRKIYNPIRRFKQYSVVYRAGAQGPLIHRWRTLHPSALWLSHIIIIRHAWLYVRRRLCVLCDSASFERPLVFYLWHCEVRGESTSSRQPMARPDRFISYRPLKKCGKRRGGCPTDTARVYICKLVQRHSDCIISLVEEHDTQKGDPNLYCRTH